MNLSKIKFIFFLLLTMLFCVNFAFSQTQMELNVEACDKYNKADAELNKVYKQIQSEYKTETLFLQKLKKAQNAWVAFRDAQLEAKFPFKPKENPTQLYGSVYPMCRCLVLEEITQKRVEELKVWIDGIEEGDVCTGSVKIKERDSARSSTLTNRSERADLANERRTKP